MMKTRTKYLIFTTFLIVVQIVVSQSNTSNLSSSPYSLYGLGVSNETNTGQTNALGNSGVAMPSSVLINNLNPASFGTIPLESFMFDIGITSRYENFYENNNVENVINGNLSNIAIAFPVTKKSALGFTLTPFTNVGYSFTGIETNIDGSNETFLSNIYGSGGLNDIKLTYGYALSKKLNLGISSSYLFGKISQEEISYLGTNGLNITKESFYNGFLLELGMQYRLTDAIVLGSIIDLPTSLKGNQTKTAVINDNTSSELEESSLENFTLPLKLGVGVHAKLNEKLFVNLDYKRNFWSATNQSDFTGNYVDQNIIAFGMQYLPQKRSPNYLNRISYRVGFNIDNGNLTVKDKRVNKFSMNLGLGLPINTRNFSSINIAYSYGQKGKLVNNLIKENVHSLTLNLSLRDFWFRKRKIL